MTNIDIYNVLESQWNSIDSNMDDLVAACTTKQQGQALMLAWQTAGANATQVRNKIFTSDDATLTALTDQVKQANQTVAQSLADLQQIVNNVNRLNTLIGGLVQAVGLGSKLVGLVAGL